MDNNEQLNGLLNIHDLLVDSRKGYLEACNRAEDHRTKDLMLSFSRERIALESELMAEVRRRHPAAIEGNGTMKGDLHRKWMDIRHALTTSNDANVLNECERGEGYLLMRYDQLLSGNDLDERTHALLTKQRAQVQGNVNHVKSQLKLAEAVEK